MADPATVRTALHALLRHFGMTTIFGNPGSTELTMLHGLPDDMRYVLGLQESIVVGMADGYAQATGNAAFVNLHSSAGLGHAMGNLFTAYRNNTPLVVTAGQQARSILPYEPFLYAERATEMPRPFVKWACEPARAEDVPLAIARAYHVAVQAPCGPTFVSVPVDDWDRPCAPFVPTRVSRTMRAADALQQAARLLRAATRPVIVAGAAAATARPALRQFAEGCGVPVWVAPLAARNPFPEDHPLFRGFLTASREAVVQALGDADLVLVVGAPAFTYHVEGAGPLLPPNARLILLVDNPAVAARVPEGLAITGELGDALERLAELLGSHSVAPPTARAAIVAPAPNRLTPELLAARLHALRPRGIAIVEEAPSMRAPMHDHLPMLDGDEFHTCASGGLGHGLPAAIGVALGQPERPVLCLLGDGSSMYAIQGLWSASTLGANVRFVIVNNGGYAALDQMGQLFGIEAVGSTVEGIDFVALAEGQGVPAARIESAAGLDEALQTLFSGMGPRLLEIVLEQQEQVRGTGDGDAEG